MKASLNHLLPFSKIIYKIVFWISILFIAISVLSLTVGQLLPLEFTDNKIQHIFYDIIILGLPFAVALTLFGTIKRTNSNAKNLTYAGLTIMTSLLCFATQVFLLFSFGFGTWITETTIYKHKFENRQIKEQLYDIGAFGYGGRRIVEIKPFLKYWIRPTPIDTLTFKKNEWKLVNEQGDIKRP